MEKLGNQLTNEYDVDILCGYAIPHNPNASNGLMFDTKTLTGGPITREYAERRMANLFLIAPRTDPYVRVYAYGSYQGRRAAKRAMG